MPNEPMARTGKAPAKRRTAPRKTAAGSTALAKKVEQQAKTQAVLEQQVQDLQMSVNGVQAGMGEVLEALRGMRAQDRPTSFNQHRVESHDIQIAQDEDIRIERDPRTGTQKLVGGRVLDVNSPEYKAKCDELAFMAEMVTIHIHEEHSEAVNPQNTFSVWVNGKQWFFRRGMTKAVPRYIVNGLLMAAPVHTGSKEVLVNSQEGDPIRQMRYPRTRGLRFDFSVEEDPSGDRGRAWLRETRARTTGKMRDAAVA